MPSCGWCRAASISQAEIEYAPDGSTFCRRCAETLKGRANQSSPIDYGMDYLRGGPIAVAGRLVHTCALEISARKTSTRSIYLRGSLILLVGTLIGVMLLLRPRCM